MFELAPPARVPPAHADDLGPGGLIAHAVSEVGDVAPTADPGDLLSGVDAPLDGVLGSAQGSKLLFDLINAAFILLVGRGLLGDGPSIGETIPLIGGTWEGLNTSPVGAMLPFLGNLGDGDFLFGNGGDGGELGDFKDVYNGSDTGLWGNGARQVLAGVEIS